MEVLDNGVMQARGGTPGAKHKVRKCETNFTLICAPTFDGSERQPLIEMQINFFEMEIYFFILEMHGNLTETKINLFGNAKQLLTKMQGNWHKT